MKRLLFLLVLVTAVGCDALDPATGTVGNDPTTSNPTDDNPNNNSGGNDSSVDVRGTITAMDATHVTVAGQVYETTADTRYLGHRNVPLSRADFRVGDFVEAEGHRRGGVAIADKLKQED